MNYIVALLLLFMGQEDAFWLLCHIVEDVACVTCEDAHYFYHEKTLQGYVFVTNQGCEIFHNIVRNGWYTAILTILDQLPSFHDYTV